MKRLLSWLLVLVMVFGLLPMSAFAAEVGVDTDFETEPDIIVDLWELQVGGSSANPKDLTVDLLNEGDFTAVVTVPAGKTMYLTASRVAGMEMTINDGEAVICGGNPMSPYAWTITNNGAEAAEYIIKVAFPAGHQMNPVVIESMSWYSDEVSQAAGDNDGFFYKYIAEDDGTITLYFDAVYDDEGNVVDLGTQRNITVTNNNTYENVNLLADGVDNYGLELNVEVTKGDEIIINTAWVKDADGNYYPEATYSWTGNFSYPAGSEKNPITLEWAWNDAYTDATASATVAAGETVYFNGNAGMILTVDGVETEMTETGVFTITNSGDAEATYALALATPVGAQPNPEVIENIDGYTSEKHLYVDGAYYYIWTATEDGTVTLDVTDGANITVDKLTYTEGSEDPVSEQFALAEPTVDENWNYTGWNVAENLVIEVVAGQQLKIQVNALTDWSTWTTPAIDYTLSGSFEAAAKLPAVTLNGVNCSADAEILLGAGFVIPAEFLNDPDAYCVVTKITNYDSGATTKTSSYTSAELAAITADGRGRRIIWQGIASAEMTAEVKFEFVSGNGKYFPVINTYDNNLEAEYAYLSVLDYAELALTKGTTAQKNMMQALLTYGGYAQIFFKVDTANLAYDMLTKHGYAVADISGITADTITQSIVTNGSAGIVQNSQTAALDSRISLSPYFWPQSGYSIDDFTFVIDYVSVVNKQKVHSDMEVEPTYMNGKAWLVTIPDIPAPLLDEMYTITATNANGETYTVQTSVLCYLKAALASDKATAAQKDLARALYNYNEFANNFFGL